MRSHVLSFSDAVMASAPIDDSDERSEITHAVIHDSYHYSTPFVEDLAAQRRIDQEASRRRAGKGLKDRLYDVMRVLARKLFT